ncbi:MAG: UDP-N-acetylglucosamine 2-epimerase (non-hydrolyzing) [Proteobacteria bacterium]|nr:UDP-N-acetylglucosamine 2-epimerase (non-hydrolyzing) [Pseudomonadota bacterium]
MSIKVLSVFGTRPEAIKMAPVVRELQRRVPQFQSVVCVTGQHRDMLDQIMRSFDLKADFDLNVMQHAQSPAQVASRVLAELPQVLEQVSPDMMLVQGDTTTTCAAALTAFMHRVPVGHVEAGLRTGDLSQPFPEEMNRRVTTVVSTLHFAPTLDARIALAREGVGADHIIHAGNTVIDALLQSVRSDYAFEDGRLANLPRDGRILLVTTHRRESIGEPMRQICEGILRIKQAHPELTVVIPLHRNPAVRDIVLGKLAGQAGIVLVDPLPYLDFVHMMARSDVILTDSGGVQEEAPSLKRPVLVVREVTERPEGVAAGVAKLLGTNPQRIFDEVHRLLTDEAAYRAMVGVKNPYGDGHAARYIVDAIECWQQQRSRKRA